MFPVNDIVCNLLRTPFARMDDEDKKEILNLKKPTPILSVNKTVNIRNTGGSYNRRFKNTWYEQYQWLCGSHYMQKLFCWPCLLMGSKNSTWSKHGFDDFLNVTRSLHKHEGSSEHLKSAIKFKQLTRDDDKITGDALKKSRLQIIKFNEIVELNRRFMELPIDAVLYLGKPELDSENLFHDLLLLLVKRSPIDIQNQFEKIQHLFSGDPKIIQNEIVDCISDYIQEAIAKEINETIFFAIQVDMVLKSHCSIILRYVNSGAKLVERFIGFYEVSEDRTLFNVLDVALEEHHYKSKLMAQCYDGASVKSGRLSGLQADIKEEVPQAIFVHSLAHRLDLVLQQSLMGIAKCRKFFANIKGLQSFLDDSNPAMGTRIPKSLVAASNSNILRTILTEWDGLKGIFEQIIDHPSSDETVIRQSEAFLNKFNEFEFTFLVLFFCEIFELCNVLFTDLQHNSLDIGHCYSQIKIVHEKLMFKRNKDEFKYIFSAASLKTATAQCRLPQDPLIADDQIFESYKILYYEILDTILLEIDTRFKDTQKLLFISLADSSKFNEYGVKFPVEAFKNVKSTYPNLYGPLEMNRLKNELEIIYDDVQYRDKHLQEVIQLLYENYDIFRESYKLFSLILTMPSTYLTGNECFSRLKNIETFLRNSALQEQKILRGLAGISIENELLLELQMSGPFYEEVINKFAHLDDRIDLIYKQ